MEKLRHVKIKGMFLVNSGNIECRDLRNWETMVRVSRG